MSFTDIFCDSSTLAATTALGLSESTATLSDAVSRLSDRAGTFEYDSAANSDPRDQRRLVRAVRDALRDLASVYDWRYFQKGFRVTTSPAVSVTAASYVASSGTLTITSAQEWPSDAVYGTVTIDGVVYNIAQRTSSTVIVLDSTGKRQSNFTGSCQWLRSSYAIPLVRSIYGVWEEGPERPLAYLSPTEFRIREAHFPNGGTPVAFTIQHGNRDHYFAVSPASSVSTSFLIAAKLSPSYPMVFRDIVSVTGAADSYQLTCATANSNWVGSVVRIAPTGPSTDDAKTQAILYDGWGWQSVITNVAGTTMTVKSMVPRTLTSEVAIVSSPIDVSATMQTYFESLAFERYCRNHKHDSLADAVRIAGADLTRAMEADALVNESSRFTFMSDKLPLYDIHSETWE